MKTVSISDFKARCLALLASVEATGEPLVVTRRGKPVARVVPERAAKKRSWLGCMRGTAKIVGDVVGPVLPPEEWGALRE